jgi:hypothetical protein
VNEHVNYESKYRHAHKGPSEATQPMYSSLRITVQATMTGISEVWGVATKHCEEGLANQAFTGLNTSDRLASAVLGECT